MKVSIVVPAYNEEDNLPILVKNLQGLIKREKLNAEVILVDDNSTDSTPKICDMLETKYDNIFTIHRIGDRGMGNTLTEGTKKATGKVIVWVMADLSDDLNTIPKFLEEIKNGYDIVFGSRYMKGGSYGDLSFFKATLSRGFTTLSKIFTGIKVHDITNAFRAFKKEVFNFIKLESTDFAISPEFALKAYLAGFKLGEVPTAYRNRKKGTTKFKMFEMAKKYFKVFLWLSKKRSRKNPPPTTNLHLYLPPGCEIYWKHRKPWVPARLLVTDPTSKFVIDKENRAVDFIRKYGTDLVIAEFCCGAGDLVSRILALPNVKRVYAIDINKKSLEQLQERVAFNPVKDKLVILHGDCYGNELFNPVSNLDIVVCLNSLMHLKDLPSILNIFASKLKKEGIFIGSFNAEERALKQYYRNKGIIKGWSLVFRYRILTYLYRKGWFKRSIIRLARRGVVRTSSQTKQQVKSLVSPYFKIITFITDIHHFVIAKLKDVVKDELKPSV